MPRDWFAEIREKVNKAQGAAPAQAKPEAPPEAPSRVTPVSDPTPAPAPASRRSFLAPTDPGRNYAAMYRQAFDFHAAHNDPPSEPEAARSFWCRENEDLLDLTGDAPDPFLCDLLVAVHCEIEREYARRRAREG